MATPIRFLSRWAAQIGQIHRSAQRAAPPPRRWSREGPERSRRLYLRSVRPVAAQRANATTHPCRAQTDTTPRHAHRMTVPGYCTVSICGMDPGSPRGRRGPSRPTRGVGGEPQRQRQRERRRREETRSRRPHRTDGMRDPPCKPAPTPRSDECPPPASPRVAGRIPCRLPRTYLMASDRSVTSALRLA